MKTEPSRYMITDSGQKVFVISDRGRLWYVATLKGKGFMINKNKLKEIEDE